MNTSTAVLPQSIGSKADSKENNGNPISWEALLPSGILEAFKNRIGTSALVGDVSQLAVESHYFDAFATLRSELGDELFRKLSDQQKRFMTDMVGSVDFGRSIDLDEVSRVIKSDDIS